MAVAGRKPIPAELGRLINLSWLSLGNNALSGPIPAELGNLVNLQALILDDNRLSGPIPAELGKLVNLDQLRLSNNALSGPIPAELGHLVNLRILTLDGDTGLCLAADFPRTSVFARRAQAQGVSFCSDSDSFTDDPIVSGETPIKAVHFTELRMRIDDLRGAHGLSAFPWTDSALAPGGAIRSVHMSELRTALRQAYDAACRSIDFNTTSVQPGLEVRASDVNELRRAVATLEQ